MAYQKVFRSVIKRQAHGFDGANWNPSFGVGLHLDANRKEPPVVEFMRLPDGRVLGTSGDNLMGQLYEEFHLGPKGSSLPPLLEKALKLYTDHNKEALSRVQPIRDALLKASAVPAVTSHAGTVKDGIREYSERDGSIKNLREAGLVEQGSELLAGPILTGIKDLAEGNPTKSAIQALAALAVWGKSVADQAKASPEGPAAFMDQYLKARVQQLAETVESSRVGTQETYEELVDVFEHHAYLKDGLANVRVMIVEPSSIYYDKTQQLSRGTNASELEKQGIPFDARIYELQQQGFEPHQRFVDDIHGGAREAQAAGFQVGLSELREYRRLFHSDPENQAELTEHASLTKLDTQTTDLDDDEPAPSPG